MRGGCGHIQFIRAKNGFKKFLCQKVSIEINTWMPLRSANEGAQFFFFSLLFFLLGEGVVVNKFELIFLWK